jgi:acyl carrier protein
MGLFFKNDIRLRSHLNRLKLSEEKEREIFESQDPILSIVEAVLGTNLTIDETAHLVYEYQMDSLQRIELLMYLEKWIGKKIPQEDHNLSYFFSVAGIREYIKDKIFEV